MPDPAPETDASKWPEPLRKLRELCIVLAYTGDECDEAKKHSQAVADLIASLTVEQNETAEEVQRVLAEKHAAQASEKRMREAVALLLPVVEGLQDQQAMRDDKFQPYIDAAKTAGIAALAPSAAAAPAVGLVDVDVLLTNGYGFIANHGTSHGRGNRTGWSRPGSEFWDYCPTFAEAHRAASAHFNASKGVNDNG